MDSSPQTPQRPLTDRVGEVVESDSSSFLSESYDLHRPPALGSLVVASDGEFEVIGVVSQSGTSPTQQGRTVAARGRDEPTVDSLYASHPEIEKLLTTRFTAQVVGYRNGAGFAQRLPARPPKVHGFVYVCTMDEIAEFGKVAAVPGHADCGPGTGGRPGDRGVLARPGVGVRGPASLSVGRRQSPDPAPLRRPPEALRPACGD